MPLPPQIERVWRMIVHAKNVFLSPVTPLYVKLALGLGLVYIISPYDLIPDWIPVLGEVDDLTLAALLILWAGQFSVPRD